VVRSQVVRFDVVRSDGNFCCDKYFSCSVLYAEAKIIIVRYVIPVVLSNNKNTLNGTYVYRHKHNYIPYSTFTITTTTCFGHQCWPSSGCT